MRRPRRSPPFPYTPLSRPGHVGRARRGPPPAVGGRVSAPAVGTVRPRTSRISQVVTLIAVVVPPLGIASAAGLLWGVDRTSTRLNSSHANISYDDFCLKKKADGDPAPARGLPLAGHHCAAATPPALAGS